MGDCFYIKTHSSIRKICWKFDSVVFIYSPDDFFFFWGGGGCMGAKSTKHVLLRRQSHVYLQAKSCVNDRTTFSNSHKTAPKLFQLVKSWIIKWTWWLNKGFLGRGKSRRNRDFSPLYRNAAFFSMRGNLQTRLPCITQIHLLLCSRLWAVVRDSPEGTKWQCSCYDFSWFFFFFTIPNSHVFSTWITTNLFQQHLQMTELCALCAMTEESLKWYPACVLVLFLADQRGGIFNFILITDRRGGIFNFTLRTREVAFSTLH